MASNTKAAEANPWMKEFTIQDIKVVLDTRKFHDYDFVRKLSELGETSLDGIFFTVESILQDHDEVIDKLRDEDGYLSIEKYADFAHEIVNTVNEAKN